MNRNRRAVHKIGNVAPLYNDSLETQCTCKMKKTKTKRQWIWHMRGEKEDRMFTFISRWGIGYGHRDSSKVFEWIVHCICVHKYFMRVLHKHKLICIKTSVCVCVCALRLSELDRLSWTHKCSSVASVHRGGGRKVLSLMFAFHF